MGQQHTEQKDGKADGARSDDRAPRYLAEANRVSPSSGQETKPFFLFLLLRALDRGAQRQRVGPESGIAPEGIPILPRRGCRRSAGAVFRPGGHGTTGQAHPVLHR
jgi:hypothetical protein